MRNEKILLRCGTSINIPHPESYKDCLLLIKSDNYRVVGKYEPTKTIVMKNLRHLGDSVLFWFRLCQYRGLFFRFFCSVFYVISKRANIYIPPLTRIGYGIELGHKMSIVINGGTIIGNNVSLSHFVSIGTNHDTPAIIGDNVYIGPNTCIVENVRIGNGVTIGAGAVVTRDIPNNATAVGSPAKVINYNNPSRYILNPFPLDS